MPEKIGDYYIDFTVNDGKGKQQLNQLDEQMSKTAKKQEGMFDILKSGWATVATGINQAVQLFAQVGQAIGQLVSGAAKFEQASSAMWEQFGVRANNAITALRKASGGTVKDAALVQAANRAMALGVTKDFGEMAKLMEYARLRARAMGTDTTQAFDDIVTGIGRGSPMILDNLGIITKGWAEEAQASGKAYNAQFILNKVLQQAGQELGNTGKMALTSAEKLQRLSATWENLKEKIGTLLLDAMDPLAKLKRLTSDLSSLQSDYITVLRDLKTAQDNLNVSEATSLQVRKAKLQTALLEKKEELEKEKKKIMQSKRSKEYTFGDEVALMEYTQTFDATIANYQKAFAKLIQMREKIEKAKVTPDAVIDLEALVKAEDDFNKAARELANRKDGLTAIYEKFLNPYTQSKQEYANNMKNYLLRLSEAQRAVIAVKNAAGDNTDKLQKENTKTEKELAEWAEKAAEYAAVISGLKDVEKQLEDLRDVKVAAPSSADKSGGGDKKVTDAWAAFNEQMKTAIAHGAGMAVIEGKLSAKIRANADEYQRYLAIMREGEPLTKDQQTFVANFEATQEILKGVTDAAAEMQKRIAAVRAEYAALVGEGLRLLRSQTSLRKELKKQIVEGWGGVVGAMLRVPEAARQLEAAKKSIDAIRKKLTEAYAAFDAAKGTGNAAAMEAAKQNVAGLTSQLGAAEQASASATSGMVSGWMAVAQGVADFALEMWNAMEATGDWGEAAETAIQGLAQKIPIVGGLGAKLIDTLWETDTEKREKAKEALDNFQNLSQKYIDLGMMSQSEYLAGLKDQLASMEAVGASEEDILDILLEIKAVEEDITAEKKEQLEAVRDARDEAKQAYLDEISRRAGLGAIDTENWAQASKIIASMSSAGLSQSELVDALNSLGYKTSNLGIAASGAVGQTVEISGNIITNVYQATVDSALQQMAAAVKNAISE